jgi:hypothetical protein
MIGETLAGMGETNVYRILMGKSVEKRPLRRSRRICVVRIEGSCNWLRIISSGMLLVLNLQVLLPWR